MIFDFDQEGPPACPDVPGSASHDHGDPAEIAQLLDDHHLVGLAVDPAVRERVAHALAEQLEALPDSEVVEIRGDRVTGLDALCRQLAGRGNATPGRPRRVESSVDGLIGLLRAGSPDRKHQFFIWHDADTLLESDAGLFSRIVNAFLGVAAEREFVTSDVLVLQRVVFLGGETLGACAERVDGPFRSWLLEEGASPFWEVVSCVDRPQVLSYRLDG